MVEQVYTAEEVAAILKATPQTVRRYLVAGKLGGFKVGRDWRVTESDLEAFIKGSRSGVGGASPERER